MEEKGWSFKRDDEGNSLGKNAGVAIESFTLYDKITKQYADRNTLDGMTEAEREDYMDENVIGLRKYYRVFNGDIIERRGKALWGIASMWWEWMTSLAVIPGRKRRALCKRRRFCLQSESQA